MHAVVIIGMESTASNINDLKKQLQKLGISTSTPGLQGDDRFEELSQRFESSRKLNSHSNDSSEPAQPVNDSFVVPSLNQLSIGEIRSRLTALGENTNTPGVVGEERRNVLMRRLISALCVDDHETAIEEITSIKETVSKNNRSAPRPPPDLDDVPTAVRRHRIVDDAER